MADIRQTIQYANYLKQIGWIVERTAEVNYFIKKLPLIGFIVKIQRPDEIRINKIREITKKYRAFQIIIEPKTELDAKYLLSIRFRLSKSTYLPSKTLLLELTLSEKSLLKKLKKDARGAVRQNENLATSFASPKEFRNAWKSSVGLRRYVPPLSHLTALKKSFKNNCIFLVSQINSGAIFLLADGIAYYWQAFTNKEGRQKLYQYKIVWEGILWAKKKGARIFDFEGIYDERFPNKNWLGFTHFKKSFGGYGIEYPGCFIKNLLPF